MPFFPGNKSRQLTIPLSLMLVVFMNEIIESSEKVLFRVPNDERNYNIEPSGQLISL